MGITLGIKRKLRKFADITAADPEKNPQKWKATKIYKRLKREYAKGNIRIE